MSASLLELQQPITVSEILARYKATKASTRPSLVTELEPFAPHLLSRLSDEYLVLIFEQLPSTRDLYAACLASKRFYACGIRALYRSMRFISPGRFHHNMQRFWRDGPGNSARMKSAPQTISLRGMFHTVSGPWMLTGGDWQFGVDAPTLHEIVETSPANQCTALFAQLLEFVSLRNLTFEDCFLPDKESLALILLGMPRLRSLTIRNCRFMEELLPQSNSYGAFSRLPLTSLTLVKNSVSRLVFEDDDDASNTARRAAWVQAGSPLHFTLAPALSTLEITWDDALADAYALKTNLGAESLGLSSHLTGLTLHVPPHRSDTNSMHLVHFLRNECAHVRALQVKEWHGDFFRGAQVLPMLESYSGPGCLARAVVRERCREVHLTGGGEHSVGVTMEMLADLPREVAVLSFMVVQWDMEVLYAVTQLFENLEELKILCRQGHPDEDTFLIMPWQFFRSYTKLRVLHIYDLGITVKTRGLDVRFFTPTTPSEEARRQLTPTPHTMRGLWNKACPSLVEAQWVHNEVMFRRGEEWTVVREAPKEPRADEARSVDEDDEPGYSPHHFDELFDFPAAHNPFLEATYEEFQEDDDDVSVSDEGDVGSPFEGSD
ncbi:hypothetical protein CPB85DRAFT_1306443 [Mucidula mucida]|nr:hypothetical protein CPB85DRAFT_1306443 [Mucidula mucida]